MVEDEFVAMAHKFTAHLHAAEYQRLKKLAQDQNADAIRSLSRPVTAPMTSRVKRRQAVVSLKKSQRIGIKSALSRTRNSDEEEVDELPWAGTNLEDLMDSPRKKLVPLSRMVSTASGTRAAALSRKDSALRPKSIRQSDSVQQATTTRKSSVRFQHARSDREDLDKDLLYCPPTAISNGPTPSAKTLQRTSSTALERAVKAPPTEATSAPAFVVSNIDDSDSPVETMFGQHFRERRTKRLAQSSSAKPSKEVNQPRETTPPKGPVRSSLSIPSL